MLYSIWNLSELYVVLKLDTGGQGYTCFILFSTAFTMRFDGIKLSIVIQDMIDEILLLSSLAKFEYSEQNQYTIKYILECRLLFQRIMLQPMHSCVETNKIKLLF